MRHKIYVRKSKEELVDICTKMYEQNKKDDKMFLLNKNGKLKMLKEEFTKIKPGLVIKSENEILKNPRSFFLNKFEELEAGFDENFDVEFKCGSLMLKRDRTQMNLKKLEREKYIRKITLRRECQKPICFYGRKISKAITRRYFFLFENEMVAMKNILNLYQTFDGIFISELKIIADGKCKYEVGRELKIGNSVKEALIFLCRKEGDIIIIIGEMMNGFLDENKMVMEKKMKRLFE